MQVGIGEMEGELVVAVTLLGEDGVVLTEGFTANTARIYADALIRFAVVVDAHTEE